MNENKKREWVKNAIIIFLVIMLLLTFFSNTIMNYSLPEVSAQYVSGGTLSEQIRGSGTVEANQVYEVKIDETRTIASVEVAVGDTVEKGQTIFKLEDSESAELEAAEKDLKAAKKAYNEALLTAGYDYRSDELDISNQEEDLALLKEELSKISGYQSAYEKAKSKVKEINNEIKSLEKDSKEYDDILQAIANKDYASLKKTDYDKITKAQAALESAEKAKTKTEEKIQEYESNISSDGNDAAISSAKQAIENKQLEIDRTQLSLSEEYIKLKEDPQYDTSKISELESELSKLNLELKHLNEDYDRQISKSTTYSRNKQLLNAEKTLLEMNKTKYDNAQKTLDEIIASIKLSAKNKADAIQDKIDDAKDRLSEAQADEAEAEKKANITVEDQKAKIREAENAIEKAKISLSNKQRDNAIEASKYALNIQELLDAVDNAEKKVEKFKSKSIGSEITAQVGGKITEIAYVAGEEAEIASTVAKIEMSEKGYTLEIPVTTEQAKKVKVGDEAEIQYFWYGDASAVLRSINPDKSNPAQSRILSFSVTGDVTPGQNLQIAMGSKGQRYEYIVPNSAIREDTNGKFVLAVIARSSPLGNRYIAERVDVEVLASDDTSSAISGGILGGEFIITTSTKPIEPGMQVRLVE